MQNRPPIVVILGHVDHGKTSLLDALLKTSIAAKETGGITQSTRAFQAAGFTFIDTPGHQAFNQMRSRGDKVADMALLIVSGVDGVMPQTKESIAVIKANGHPYIVVVTKADLPDFDLDKVKAQLAENGVLVEGYGGDVPFVAVSAKTGQGLTDLLELIGLVNQLHPTQADPDAPLAAVVLESSLDAKRGAVAVVLVKNGTLTLSQSLYLGSKVVGKVKAITATSGDKLNQAGPAVPAEVLGLTEMPAAGSILSSVAQADVVSTPTVTSTGGGFKVILKADVVGSLEALLGALPADLTIVSSGVGEIGESDVLLAQSTAAVILGFNTKVPSSTAKLAEIDKVRIITSKIIYELLDQVDLLIRPQEKEKVVGKAEVLAEFKMNGQRIAGCRCLEGEMKRSAQVKLGEKLARIKSLRLGKEEVEVVKAGQEFGMVTSPAIDFKVGETIIALESYGQA